MEHTALIHWNSCPELLNVPQIPSKAIKKIHVYDFDNTLYNSPHPNKELYTKPLLNQLTNSTVISNKSWWTEIEVLKQSFEDMLKCDPKDRKTYWNQDIVQLAQSSFADSSTLSIMLTGRREHIFAEIFSELFSVFNEVKFNAYCLRRESIGSNTNEYKTIMISDLINTYSSSLEEIILYDDRLGQVRQFEKFFNDLKPLYSWRIVHVTPTFKSLRPEDELDCIQRSFSSSEISEMNLTIEWTPKQYGYYLTRQSYKSLLRFTYAFTKRKYKMSSLPYYPLLLPCVDDNESIPNDELIKIIANNEAETVRKLKESDEVMHDFENHANLEGTCIISFDVVQIGLAEAANTITVIYKARPSDRKRYVWSQFKQWLVTIDNRYDKKDATLKTSVTEIFNGKKPTQPFRWVRLREPLRIKTFLGHHSRLTLVNSS